MLYLQADTVSDVMTRGAYSIEESASAEQALAFMTSRGFGSAVVIDVAGHPIGVVTRTDMLAYARDRRARVPGAKTTTVRDLMTPAVFSVREAAPVRSAVDQLVALNVHHLFVIDEAGVVVGVVTPMDIVRKLA
jgi:predicted transcriptional regulator